MAFRPFEVSIPHIIYALLGAFIVLFGMFSLFLRERLYVGEAIWAFIFGVIIGPYCAGIFDPRSWAHSQEAAGDLITLEFTRVVLAIGVFAIGVELPKAYMKKHWKSLFFLLVPVMTWGWFVSAALIFALIPGLNFLSSLAVAACLTPTDPILAAAVVGGKWADKHVPAHIRHLLAAESACNDGAAFPFLYLALYLSIDQTVGEAVRDWFLSLWLYQVIMGSVIGCLLGFSFRHLMKFCQRHDLIDRNSYVAQYVSLTMLTIGVTTLLGSDDLLAAFFCGTAFAWDGFFNKQTEESVFSSVMDTLFNVAAFIYVGAWMPFNQFQNTQLTLSVWRLVVIALLVLLLRRLPVMIALYRWIPDIKTFREAMFTGHFGPIGIGAVFISTLAVMVLENARAGADAASSSRVGGASLQQIELLEQTIQPIVAFMVLCSIAVHGLSVPSFSLGRRVHSVSRTWSRRDTFGSTARGRGGGRGGGAGGAGSRLPEWANQARMVTRAEDVVVNRDPVDLERGDLVLEKEDVDLDRDGDGEKEEIEREQEQGSSGTTAAESVHSGEEGVEVGVERYENEEEMMQGSGMSGDTRIADPASASPSNHARFVEGDVLVAEPAPVPASGGFSPREEGRGVRYPQLQPHPHTGTYMGTQELPEQPQEIQVQIPRSRQEAVRRSPPPLAPPLASPLSQPQQPPPTTTSTTVRKPVAQGTHKDIHEDAEKEKETEKEEKEKEKRSETAREDQKEHKHGWMQYHLWPHEPLSIPRPDREQPPDGGGGGVGGVGDRWGGGGFREGEGQVEGEGEKGGQVQVREWMEGSQRVIERRVGPGDDVEVTVIRETEPALRTRWHGKAHELHHDAEEVGHAIGRELDRLRARAREAVGGGASPSPASAPASRRGVGAAGIGGAGNGEGEGAGHEWVSRVFGASSEEGRDREGDREGEEEESVLFSRAKQAELDERRRQLQVEQQSQPQARPQPQPQLQPQHREDRVADSALDDEDGEDADDAEEEEDEDDSAWASDPDFDGTPPLTLTSDAGGVHPKLARAGSRASRALTHHHQLRSVHSSHPHPYPHAHQHTHAARRRRGVSSRRGSMESSEQARGRPGAEELAAPLESASNTGHTDPSPSLPPPPSASGGASTASPNQRAQHHPQQRPSLSQTRPLTSSALSGASRSSTSTSSNSPFSAPSRSGTMRSRAGTADSSLRNNRVDIIRFAHGGAGSSAGSRRGTPGSTRESSPARSVRFVDGPSAPSSSHVGQGGDGVRGAGQVAQVVPPLVDSPVEERDAGGDV